MAGRYAGHVIRPLEERHMPTAKDVRELALGKEGVTTVDLKKKVERSLVDGLKENMPLVLEAAIRAATEGGRDGLGNPMMQKFLLERFVGMASSEEKRGKEIPSININISGIGDERKQEKIISGVVHSAIQDEESGS